MTKLAGTRRARNQATSLAIPRQNSLTDNGKTRQNLSPETLGSMNKEQLRAECRKRGQRTTGGAFEGVEDQVSPFGYGRGEGVDAGHGDPEWICSKEKPQYDTVFQSLNPIDGKVTGAAAKTEMVKSKLPNSVLGKIWKLSDIDKDGFLDEEEFALAMHLIRVKIDGHDLPSELPPHLVPPSKRN